MSAQSRRKFLGTASMGTIGALSMPQIVSAALINESARKRIKLNEHDVVLFQGDSITDFGRARPLVVNNGLGSGYAFVSASELLCRYPQKQLKIYNAGISGNKVYQLQERWETDCLAIAPNVLSILIGVNDYWHTLNGSYAGSLDIYRDSYRKLLDLTLTKLAGVHLIIGEPFAVKGVSIVNEQWFPAFDGYREVAKALANEYQATFIPYQRIFDEALKSAPGSYWTKDGVHPSVAGISLMAHAWLKCIDGF